jgi:hypothetical protein
MKKDEETEGEGKREVLWRKKERGREEKMEKAEKRRKKSY